MSQRISTGWLKEQMRQLPHAPSPLVWGDYPKDRKDPHILTRKQRRSVGFAACLVLFGLGVLAWVLHWAASS